MHICGTLQQEGTTLSTPPALTDTRRTIAGLPVLRPAVPDCCVGGCFYGPARVATLLRLMDELAQGGYEPCESLLATLVRELLPVGLDGDSPYERRSDSFGPSEPSGAQIVADLHRSLRAGKRDPVAIARHLCPYAVDEPASEAQ